MFGYPDDGPEDPPFVTPGVFWASLVGLLVWIAVGLILVAGLSN